VPTDRTRIRELLTQPSESLNVEIKRWLDPDQEIGTAKIVKAVLALRNRNGGALVLGFDNRTLEPNDANRPGDLHASFHVDIIQGLVSRFASESFEVEIVFEAVSGREHVVIVVPDGVTAPVAVRRELALKNERLLAVGDVYFRTLNANGTPSTARARPEDWRVMLDICFENREADIGRFLRRHLGPRAAAVGAALSSAQQQASLHPVIQLLREGEVRYLAALEKRTFDDAEKRLVDAGKWSVALVCNPERAEAVTDKTFLNIVGSSNPNYTGWPLWRDPRPVRDRICRPGIVDGAWELLLVSQPVDTLSIPRLEFSRFDAKGAFYSLRNLQDDVNQSFGPALYLDPVLVLRRVTEALAVGIAIAKSLGWQPPANLAFAFSWTKLKGRQLSPWADPFSTLGGGVANDDVIETFVTLGLDTSPTALAPYVQRATERLFALFDGARVPPQAIEDVVRLVLERRNA
jgi:hypothetical protein